MDRSDSTMSTTVTLDRWDETNLAAQSSLDVPTTLLGQRTRIAWDHTYLTSVAFFNHNRTTPMGGTY